MQTKNMYYNRNLILNELDMASIFFFKNFS